MRFYFTILIASLIIERRKTKAAEYNKLKNSSKQIDIRRKRKMEKKKHEKATTSIKKK